MEQVLFRLHYRIMSNTNRLLNRSFRRSMEWSILLAAIATLAVLFVLHTSYIGSEGERSNVNCLSQYISFVNQPTHESSCQLAFDDNIDLLKIQLRSHLNLSRALKQFVQPETLNISTNESLTIQERKIHYLNQLYPEKDAFTFYFSRHRGVLMLTQESGAYNRQFRILDLNLRTDMPCFGSNLPTTLLHFSKSYDVVVMNWAIQAFNGSGYLYDVQSRELFNLHYAASSLAKKGSDLSDMGRRESYNTNSQLILDAWKQVKTAVIIPALKALYQWLGSTFQFQPPESLAWLDDWLVTLQASFPWIYFFYQYVAIRAGVVFSTTFLFFISTTLINYILRETQERMLRFTFVLQYYITHRIPYHLLIATHVIGSLVFVPIIMGIYFFLFEFFSDQLLAFLVLLIVWMGEVFSVLSLRSSTTIKYFPGIFCCYFYLFHIYFFSFPFGFLYLALTATMLLVLHAMMHFWNVYEVPAFEAGRISPVRPRMSVPVQAVHVMQRRVIQQQQQQQQMQQRQQSQQQPRNNNSNSRAVAQNMSVQNQQLRMRTGSQNETSSALPASVISNQSSNLSIALPPRSVNQVQPQVVLSPSSNNIGGNNSGGNTARAVQANIYETLEARRRRLERSNSIGGSSHGVTSPPQSHVRSLESSPMITRLAINKPVSTTEGKTMPSFPLIEAKENRVPSTEVDFDRSRSGLEDHREFLSLLFDEGASSPRLKGRSEPAVGNRHRSASAPSPSHQLYESAVNVSASAREIKREEAKKKFSIFGDFNDD